MVKRRQAVLTHADSGATMGTPYDILDRIEVSLGDCNVKDSLSYQQMKAIAKAEGSSIFDNQKPEEVAFLTKHDKCRFHVTKKRPEAPEEKLVFRFGPGDNLEEFTVHWAYELTQWQSEQIEKLCDDLSLNITYP